MVPNKAVFDKLEPLALPIVVALVGLLAFGLGRLSLVGEAAQAPRVVYPEALAAKPLSSTSAIAAAAPKPVAAGQGAYVASKNGSKYYLVTCSGANRIKQENKVYFVSSHDAQAAGYGPAANCAGI